MDYLRENYYSRQNIIGKDVRKLNIAACRLMLDIMPGLETSAVFETVSLYCIACFFFKETKIIKCISVLLRNLIVYTH